LAIKLKEEQERVRQQRDEGYNKRREMMQLGAELKKTFQVTKIVVAFF
jgi:hypothetical protein